MVGFFIVNLHNQESLRKRFGRCDLTKLRALPEAHRLAMLAVMPLVPPKARTSRTGRLTGAAIRFHFQAGSSSLASAALLELLHDLIKTE